MKMQRIQIALVGDYDAAKTAHQAIPLALDIAGRELGCEVEGVWVGTEALHHEAAIHDCLSGMQGVWGIPGSPYRNMDGALGAIRWAREGGIPFLGSCGGYQHAVLEFARNVLGYDEATTVEVDAAAGMPLIAPLVCGLVEENGEIVFEPESRIAEIHGVLRVSETYHCRYGVNQAYAGIFEGSALHISGHDLDGDPRVIELDDHPFFIASAYQPERSALRAEAHPLICAFVHAALTTRR